MQIAMKQRNVPENTSIRQRIMYAFIGFLSGGLLSIFTVLPLCGLYIRLSRDPSRDFWILLWVPLAFAMLIALWGFVSTKKMLERLTWWWQHVTDRYTG